MIQRSFSLTPQYNIWVHYLLALKMIENGWCHLKFTLFWIFLFMNVFADEKLRTTNKNDIKHSKALKITNSTNQELIFKYNNTILESTFNNLGALKYLTWINGHLDKSEVEILKEMSDLESLAFIHTHGNITLTDDILRNLTELKELVVHQNDRIVLEENSLKNLINLQVFSADDQFLKSITSETFKNCLKLQYLSLSNGFIGDIETDSFDHLKNLISITFTKMSLKYLRKNTFSNLPLLYMIDLSNNKFSQVSGEEFNNLPRLEILNLEKNFLHSFNAEIIIKKLPALNILQISENKFSCVEKLRLININLERNISLFRKRDIDRCHSARDKIQIFSA